MILSSNTIIFKRGNYMLKYNLFKIFIVLVIFTIACNEQNNSKSSSKNPYSQDSIDVFRAISFFKQRDKDSIASIINYPLSRDYPIPSVKNKSEFIKRFDEILDDSIINMIANSSYDDWKQMGWRGKMIGSGEVWMLNSDGIITSVNYQSEDERRLKEKLILEDKVRIHESLKDYIEPYYSFKTDDYLIRIDLYDIDSSGKELFRYASWKTEFSQATKPDIIINGRVEINSWHSNDFVFENHDFTYIIREGPRVGTGTEPFLQLIVKKGNKILLEQDYKSD